MCIHMFFSSAACPNPAGLLVSASVKHAGRNASLFLPVANWDLTPLPSAHDFAILRPSEKSQCADAVVDLSNADCAMRQRRAVHGLTVMARQRSLQQPGRFCIP